MLDLRTLLQQEVELNPVLEAELKEPVDSVDTDGAGSENDEFGEEFEKLSQLDQEWRDYLSQNNSYSERYDSDREKRRQHLFESHTVEENLQEHLLGQIAMLDLNDEEQMIAQLIIGNIDDYGYLQAKPAEISETSGIDEQDIENVLTIVQELDPAGIGAYDLRECLLLQLRRLGKQHSNAYEILEKHLDALAKKRYPQIAKALELEMEDVLEAASFIATLDPKPGSRFSSSNNGYVIPDVLVKRSEDGYQVIMNSDYIPHLRISNVYKDLMAEQNGRSNVKSYIRDKIRSGKFLIKSIHQRQQTIENIAKEIVKRQKDFLDHGPAHLHPMNMHQVAEVVGVHETTVSRAIAGKYMQTPQGVYEMRYFFTTGYQTNGGEAVSNTSVKGAIADLVKNEDGSKPLSDQDIVQLLNEKGIPIARRTVAKYRQELNILPSNLRKTY